MLFLQGTVDPKLLIMVSCPPVCRLLAHAGFDAREAVKFWETQSGRITECAPSEVEISSHHGSVRRIVGSSHPVNEVRVERLREELARWETEKQAVMSSLRSSSGAAT